MSDANKMESLRQELQQLRKENAYMKTVLERHKAAASATVAGLSACQALLQRLPILCFACDEEGRCLLWNEACRKLLGWEEATLKAHSEPLSLLYPEAQDREVVRAHMKQAEGRFRRYLVRTQGGAYRLQKWAYQRIAEGVVLAVGYDIAQMDKPTEEFITVDLEQTRTQFLRSFISDVSHDLKTPLSIISIKTHLLQHEDEAAQRKIHIEAIGEQIRRLEDLIDNMSEMARLDSETQLPRERCNVHSQLLEIDEGLRSMAEQKRVGINLALNADNPYIIGNPQELHRAFMNLIRNAINYTPPNGSITISTQSTDEQLQVKISDTGIGIDEADLPYIFTRFYRADSARATHTGGSGLGLSIAKRIIDMHQGSIEVETAVGEGTTFIITLPNNEQQEVV